MAQVGLQKLPKFRPLLREHFLAGLLVVVPTGVIAWLAALALDALWSFRRLVPDAWRPANWIPDPGLAFLLDVALAVAVLVALALGISVVGWGSKLLLGKKILEFFVDHVILHIPVLSTIYSALDQLLRTMTAEGSKQFSRVVYLEYPRQGLWVMAFVTGPAHGPSIPPAHLNVYVPTTPNPTSGFHLIVPESQLKESHLTVEEAFRTLLSLGIAQPPQGRDPDAPPRV